jgi:hypothetical protein
MPYLDRRHLSFDEKVKILKEKVVVTKSVFVTVNFGHLKAMIDFARLDYDGNSEVSKVVVSLIDKLREEGKISPSLALGYKMLLDMNTK